MTTADTPILHQYQISPFSAKVRRCLHYKNVAFEVVNYGMRDIGKIKKLNPRSKAPILVHGAMTVPDSTDIIRYLESTYPANPVIPQDPVQYAMAHVLEDWADESLYFYDITMRSWPNNGELLADDLLLADKGLFRKLLRPLIPRLIGKQAHGQGIGRKDKAAVCAESEEHFKAIDTLVSAKQWLVGDALTVADISVASMCTVLERAEEANAMMAALPNLTDWRERVDAATLPEDTPSHLRALV